MTGRAIADQVIGVIARTKTPEVFFNFVQLDRPNYGHGASPTILASTDSRRRFPGRVLCIAYRCPGVLLPAPAPALFTTCFACVFVGLFLSRVAR